MLFALFAKCFSYYDLVDEELTIVRSGAGCAFEYGEKITVSVMVTQTQRIIRLPFYREWHDKNIEIELDGDDYDIFAIFVHSPQYVEQIGPKQEYVTGLLLFGACGLALVIVTLGITIGVTLCCRALERKMRRQEAQANVFSYDERSTGVSIPQQYEASDKMPFKNAQSPSQPLSTPECVPIVPPLQSS